ncbi:class I SAM-dependent RNA methyltransferase [Corynebacterium camporealensis]
MTDTFTCRIDRMAHGGAGIGHAPDGRVVFVTGAFPGDTVVARPTKVKKPFIKAELDDVTSPSPLRVAPACEAAAAGAGCCDFTALDPAKELDLKAEILVDQLRGGDIAKHDLAPHQGWRTRVRFGVDKQGRAGLRKRGSHELVTGLPCAQLPDELNDALLNHTYTPGSEVIAVIDSRGQRHIVESRKVGRGKRVEKIDKVLEGGTVHARADGHEFQFPATAFWQAHVAAPDAYTQLLREWLADYSGDVAWDLYGGVGLFVPALSESLGGAKVYSVDYSPAANAASDLDNVEFRQARVEKVADQLPAPTVVVLDPPRKGAGKDVIAATAGAHPEAVVHIGCDPATFARDIGLWAEHGYSVDKLAVFNAFPGTHHFETIALLQHS